MASSIVRRILAASGAKAKRRPAVGSPLRRLILSRRSIILSMLATTFLFSGTAS